MILLYNKAGKEFKIPHAIDAKEWIATGNYLLENPKDETKSSQTSGGNSQATIDLLK